MQPVLRDFADLKFAEPTSSEFWMNLKRRSRAVIPEITPGTLEDVVCLIFFFHSSIFQYTFENKAI